MDPAAGAGTGSGGVVGTGEVPMAAVAAAAPGAVVVPVAVAAAPPAAALPAPTWRKVRLRLAQALFVLGCAAAALAFFSINSSPTADSRRLLGAACAPTDAEAAALRAASEELLLAAAAKVLGATTAVLLLPGFRVVTFFVTSLGWLTGYCASHVMWMLVACHGEVHGVLVVYYSLFIAMFCVAYLVGCLLSLCPWY